MKTVMTPIIVNNPTIYMIYWNYHVCYSLLKSELMIKFIELINTFRQLVSSDELTQQALQRNNCL